MIHQEFNRLLKTCALAQAKVAEEAGVNRGQFNNWLRTGKKLGPAKVVSLIEALLFLLDNECKARYAFLIETITAYPLYQATQNHSFPNQPVLAEHTVYIERAVESNLKELFGRSRPVNIAVIGGPKTGKTSILNWLQYQLCSRHNVVRCDFVNSPTEPLRVIERAAKLHIPQTPRLDSWKEFPDWVRRYLLKDARPCILVLDHVQNLTTIHLMSMQDGLYHFINRRSVEPSLDKLHLVVAYDEGAPKIRDTRDHASGLIRNLIPVPVPSFSESQVNALLKAIACPSKEDELDALTQFACESFHGHPFLTHNWAALYAEKKISPGKEWHLSSRLEEARNFLFKGKDDRNLFADYLDDLDKKTKEEIIRAAKAGEMGLDSTKILGLVCLWLKDSGLFIDGENNIVFASAWIRDQFAQACGELAA